MRTGREVKIFGTKYIEWDSETLCKNCDYCGSGVGWIPESYVIRCEQGVGLGYLDFTYQDISIKRLYFYHFYYGARELLEKMWHKIRKQI